MSFCAPPCAKSWRRHCAWLYTGPFAARHCANSSLSFPPATLHPLSLDTHVIPLFDGFPVRWDSTAVIVGAVAFISWTRDSHSVGARTRHCNLPRTVRATATYKERTATRPELYRQEALLPQTDRATRYVSQNLVNCRNKLYNESTTDRS